jgi:hypothetical protein
MRSFAGLLLSLALVPSAALAQEAAGLTAKELAAALGAAAQDGDSVARIRLKTQPEEGGEGTVLQVQVRSRRTPASSAVVYTVLWPAPRKGEGFLLKQDHGGAVGGTAFVPPDRETKIDAARAREPLLGSDLTYQDVIENFFLWGDQALAGRENVGKVECVILDSKPGAGASSSYGRVRSWIDPRRMIALRVEKFDRQGRLASRIETAQVARDDIGRHVPAALTVRRTGSGTVTEIEGSNLRHDAGLTDADFTAPALRGAR